MVVKSIHVTSTAQKSSGFYLENRDDVGPGACALIGVPLDGLENEPPVGRDEPRGLVCAFEPSVKSISNASPPDG